MNPPVCETTAEKREYLVNFMRNSSIVTTEQGYFCSKFLYLFGVTGTGKRELTKSIAREVFGNDWESKIYVRIDEGQKFPYKLHGTKVSTSKKVIFITNTSKYLSKWIELYSSTKCVEFRGCEIYRAPRTIMQIKWEDYTNKSTKLQVLINTKLDMLKQDLVKSKRIDTDTEKIINEKIQELNKTMTISFLNLLDIDTVSEPIVFEQNNIPMLEPSYDCDSDSDSDSPTIKTEQPSLTIIEHISSINYEPNKSNTNSSVDFIEKHVVHEEGYEVSFKDIFRKYKNWASARSKQVPLISSELKAALRNVFGDPVDDKYKGIRLI
jgi:hypothetical protein